MGGRIAVIEDDPGISDMLRKLLKLEGFEVTIVPDGNRAMGVLEAGSFEAAILDVMLPGKDGISIMRDIRGNALTRSLPVIMLTARTDSDSTWKGWQAGADLYVTKPFDPDELLRHLRGILS